MCSSGLTFTLLYRALVKDVVVIFDPQWRYTNKLQKAISIARQYNNHVCKIVPRLTMI